MGVVSRQWATRSLAQLTTTELSWGVSYFSPCSCQLITRPVGHVMID